MSVCLEKLSARYILLSIMMKIQAALTPLLLALASSTVLAQDERTNRLDDIFRDWSRPGSPGAAVAVVRRGKIVVDKGYGTANLEYNIPVTTQTVFHVASVSKQFTAMALVLLEIDGKLSLEDEVHKFLPELPDYGHPITIRQLLQHTSGIRDQWQTLGLAGWRLDDVITQEQILRLLFRQKELNFPPGTAHLYSNGGYTLAAEIVARVSGKPFPEFCDQRIFRPLGMTRTHFHQDHRRIVPDRAYSYEKTGDGYQALPLNYANVGATSLFTTASDLARWLDNFRDPKMGGKTAIARLQEQTVLADGKKIGYGLGLSLGEAAGKKTISHGGGDAGYRSFVLWYPTEELGIAVVSGLASFNSAQVANQVAALFLGEPPTSQPAPNQPASQPEAASRKYITMDPNQLDQFVGHYRLNAELDANILKKEGLLVAELPGQWSYPLKPLATNRFFIEAVDGEAEFNPKDGGGISLKFSQAGSVFTGERVGLEPVAAPDLRPYEGVYWSDELETQYTMVVKAGKLVATHPHHGEIPLTAAAKDRFRSPEWFMPSVVFVRDSSDRIIAVTLGGGRVAGIRFTRK
jgi:CubicO group peptidase (beta-lactamase class C family)